MRLLTVLLLAPVLALAHERENTAISAHSEACHHNHGNFAVGWESRYYSEGRDNLDGDSLLVNSIEYNLESLAAGVWYGNSPEQGYDELHLSLAWIQSLTDDLEGYIGYTHLRFPSDGSHDNEVGFGLAYTGLPQEIELAVDLYHSFDADGFFAEVTASREWELTEDLSTSLTGIFGMNQGYVADGHDGANHVGLSLGFSYALTERLTLGTHGTYSWGIDRKSGAADDDLLKDFFHAGISVDWSF